MDTQVESVRPQGTDLAQKMLSYRWAVFGLLATAYLIAYFHRLSNTMVANNLVREFGISPEALGILGSMYFYPYSLMQVPAGVLADKIGARKLMSMMFAVAGLGVILFGLAPHYGVAVFGRFLIGLGLSCIYVPSVKVFSTWFRRNEFATVNGMMVSAGNVGGLFASVPFAMLILTAGWRWSLAGIGIVTVLLAALIYLVVYNNPKEKGLPSLEEIDNVPAAQRSQNKNIPVLAGLKTVISNRYLWPIAIRGFTNYGVKMGFQSLWAGPYLTEIVGMPTVEAGSALMALAVGAVVSPPLAGYLSDKVLKSWKRIVVIAAVLSTLTWVPLAFFPDRLNPSNIFILMALMGLAGGLGTPSNAIVKELFPPELTGTANGVNNFFVMFGGGVYTMLLGIIIGFFVPAGGDLTLEAFRAGFRFLFGSMLIGTVAICFTKETMEQKKTA
ncbi:MAG: MFS transporter [bacterium]